MSGGLVNDIEEFRMGIWDRQYLPQLSPASAT